MNRTEAIQYLTGQLAGTYRVLLLNTTPKEYHSGDKLDECKFPGYTPAKLTSVSSGFFTDSDMIELRGKAKFTYNGSDAGFSVNGYAIFLIDKDGKENLLLLEQNPISFVLKQGVNDVSVFARFQAWPGT
jgi:hypothetical protein